MFVIFLFMKKNEEIDDYSFAKSSLLQRLNDDDYSVVEEVFNAGKTLLQVIGEDEVIEAVVKKIPSAKFKHRYIATTKCFFDNYLIMIITD